jgi:DNA-binding XRE family transcriptional regulator
MATRLGEKLHEMRKQRGLTLEKLAELAGLSKSYLWELENRESQRPRLKSSRHWRTHWASRPPISLKRTFALRKSAILTRHFFAAIRSLSPMRKSNSAKY